MDKILQVLFYLICIFYIGFYMPYGFEGTDTGYIFGSSWNIYNGILPHRDFIYTRPAIPAYFHTIFLFISETYAYLLDRSFFYIQVFFYSFLGAKLLCENFKITSNAFLYYIATLGAVISIHNYPPMGWNTIDGVFFVMIGLYFLLKKNTPLLSIFLGSVFLVLGVFSKQSFYFMPVFIFFYFLLLKEYKRLLYYSIFGLLSVLFYIGFKYATGSLFPFLEQTFQRTGAGSLVSVGVKTYYLAIKFNILYVIAGSIFLGMALKYLSKKTAYLLLHLVLAIIFCVLYLQMGDTWSKLPYVFQLLFMFTAAYALYQFIFQKDKRFLLVLLLLSLSWSASISNGYQTPIHFSLPLFFTLYLIIFPQQKNAESSKIYMPSYIAGSVLLMFLISFYVGYQTTYRDSQRNELTYSMGEVFPQLTFIKSDKATFNKYKELKELAHTYPAFTVVPSMTLAHYLTGTVNPIGTDWPLDVEINNEAEKLEKQLLEKNTVVFIENSEFSTKELEGYQLKEIIEKNWNLIETTSYFTIYSPKTK